MIHLGDAAELIPDLLANRSVDCIVTDPPYGVDALSNFAATPAGLKHAKRIEGDRDLDMALKVFGRVMGALNPKCSLECELYVFTDWKILEIWREEVEYAQFDVKQVLIWEKGWPGLGDLHTNWGQGYESIIYAKRGKRPVNHRRSGVLSFDKPTPGSQVHPHEKPVALLEELLKVSTHPGDLVVDPFAGSGSTMVAARNLGRRHVGFELDPLHHQTAQERLSQGVLF